MTKKETKILFEEDGEFTDLAQKVLDILVTFENPFSEEALSNAASENGITFEQINNNIDDKMKKYVLDEQKQRIKETAKSIKQQIDLPEQWQLIAAHKLVTEENKKRDQFSRNKDMFHEMLTYKAEQARKQKTKQAKKIVSACELLLKEEKL